MTTTKFPPSPNESEKRRSKRVAMLVADGFDEWDFCITARALRAGGCAVSIVRPGVRDIVRSWDSVEDEWGQVYAVDDHLSWEALEGFDSLVIPGGLMSLDALWRDDEARVMIGEFLHSNRPVAAICHGPQLLIDAIDLHGRKLTSCLSVRSDLQNAGAQWLDREFVRDGNLFTCGETDGLPKFAQAFRRRVTGQAEVAAIAV